MSEETGKPRPEGRGAVTTKSKLKAGTSMPVTTTKAKIQSRGETILQAARALIGTVRIAEASERGRSLKTELAIEVELTAGGIEQWLITIERTASTH